MPGKPLISCGQFLDQVDDRLSLGNVVTCQSTSPHSSGASNAVLAFHIDRGVAGNHSIDASKDFPPINMSGLKPNIAATVQDGFK